MGAVASVAKFGDGLIAVVEILGGLAVDGAFDPSSERVVLEAGGDGWALDLGEAVAAVPGVLGSNGRTTAGIGTGLAGKVAVEVVGQGAGGVDSILPLAFEGELGETVASVVLGFYRGLGYAADRCTSRYPIAFGIVFIRNGFDDAVAGRNGRMGGMAK